MMKFKKNMKTLKFCTELNKKEQIQILVVKGLLVKYGLGTLQILLIQMNEKLNINLLKQLKMQEMRRENKEKKAKMHPLLTLVKKGMLKMQMKVIIIW